MIIDNSTAIHIVLALASTLLSFLVVALLLEGFLFVLRVKDSRTRVLCRFFALLKIPFDFALFMKSDSNALKHLNPFGCERYFHKLLSQSVSAALLESLVLSILACSIWLIIRKVVQLYRSTRGLKAICLGGKTVKRHVVSSSLAKELEKRRVSIVTTHEIDVPCAFGHKAILFPQRLVESLSDAEYEAIIAHELEHLKRYDPYVKAIATLLSHAFFWIPTRWWVKRLEEEQELACDASTRGHGIEKLALAEALYTVLCKRKACVSLAVSSFTATKEGALYRIHMILEAREGAAESKLRSCLTAFVSQTPLFVGTIWIC